MNARSPLEQAAAMASVSYKGAFDAEGLRAALLSGVFPDQFTAHMVALLSEVPVSLLARVVDQLHDEAGLPRRALWCTMVDMAPALKIDADLLILSNSIFETEKDAETWWSRPHPLLNGTAPEIVAVSDDGVEKVRDLLMALKHGFVA